MNQQTEENSKYVLYGKFDLCEHTAEFDITEKQRRCESCQKSVDEQFDKFWREMIYPNGELDVEEMKGNLCDFEDLMENAKSVYSHITCGNIGNLLTTAEAVIGEADRQIQKQIDDAVAEEKEESFSMSDIPQLAQLLEKLKDEKAKTITPKFKQGERVHRSGYSDSYGEIEEIDVGIEDDGSATITYTIENVGTAWESELELSRR